MKYKWVERTKMNKKSFFISSGLLVAGAGIAIGVSFAIPNKFKRNHENNTNELIASQQKRLEEDALYAQKWSLPIHGLVGELNKIYPDLAFEFAENGMECNILDRKVITKFSLIGKAGSKLENMKVNIFISGIDAQTGAFIASFAEPEFLEEIQKIQVSNSGLSGFIKDQLRISLSTASDEVKAHYNAIDIYKN